MFLLKSKMELFMLYNCIAAVKEVFLSLHLPLYIENLFLLHYVFVLSGVRGVWMWPNRSFKTILFSIIYE